MGRHADRNGPSISRCRGGYSGRAALTGTGRNSARHAAEIEYGDTVVDGDGNLIQIVEIEVLNGEFEVFDLTIDDPCHKLHCERIALPQ